jgi:glycosyltransferase involved in cell wall biosynthesis
MEKIFGNEGVLNRVIFTGNLPYPYKALKNAKCMLMCSRYEGLPIAALEAMALGVPIVSTPVDGMRDIINHNETGILSSENEELINSVIRLLSDERLYKNMSSLSRKRFQDLNDENYYKEKLKSIYDEI